MKIIITENKFKSMVTKMIGYNLSNRIEMITSWENLTGSEKHNVFGDNKSIFVTYQNHYGPMYIFSNFKGHYYDFLQMLNLDMTGISLRKIIDEFAEE
jgi:hypothetical protein